jgi:hypothetical protein
LRLSRTVIGAAGHAAWLEQVFNVARATTWDCRTMVLAAPVSSGCAGEGRATLPRRWTGARVSAGFPWLAGTRIGAG